jgi:hypothetical protein
MAAIGISSVDVLAVLKNDYQGTPSPDQDHQSHAPGPSQQYYQ